MALKLSVRLFDRLFRVSIAPSAINPRISAYSTRSCPSSLVSSAFRGFTRATPWSSFASSVGSGCIGAGQGGVTYTKVGERA